MNESNIIKPHKLFKGSYKSIVRDMMKYAFDKYMKSKDWKDLRQSVIERDGECTECGKKYEENKGFSAHHTDYDNWGKCNREEKNDIVLLCRKCHQNTDHSFVPFFAKQSYSDAIVDQDELDEIIMSI